MRMSQVGRSSYRYRSGMRFPFFGNLISVRSCDFGRILIEFHTQMTHNSDKIVKISKNFKKIQKSV